MTNTATATNTNVPAVPDPKAPIKLGITNAALTKLEKKYKKTPDATTKEGYQAIKDAKKELTPLRTGVEKERIIQVAAAVEHQRKVNTVAAQITARIKAIEEPLYAARKKVDDEAARKKAEEEAAEELRIEKIEEKIGDIQAMAEGLLGASLDDLVKVQAEVNAIVLTDDVYMEFIEPAAKVLVQVKKQLEAAIANAKVLAEGQAKQKEQQELLDKQKRENDLKASVQRIQMAPVDLIGKPVAEMRTALEKLDGINSDDYGELSNDARNAIEDTKQKLGIMIDQQQGIEDQQSEKEEVDLEDNVEPAEIEQEEEIPAQVSSSAVSPAVQKSADEDNSVVAKAEKNTVCAIASILAGGESMNECFDVDAQNIFNAIQSGKIPNVKYSIY